MLACYGGILIGRVSAAAESNMLTLPKFNVRSQGTDTFDIELSNTNLIGGAQLAFTYNTAIGFQITEVALTSRTTGYTPPEWQRTCDKSTGLTEVRIVLYSLRGAAIIPGNGPILTVRYRTAPAGFTTTSPLNFLPDQTILSDVAFQKIEPQLTNGSISVKISSAQPPKATPPLITPEPSTLLLVLIGLCGFSMLLRKTKTLR